MHRHVYGISDEWGCSRRSRIGSGSEYD
jgi:hypothetical protein